MAKIGKSSQKDYYVPFAFHYYGLIFAKLMKDDFPEWSEKFIYRAKEFTKDYILSIKRNSASIFSLSNDSPQCFKAIRIKILKNVQLFLGIFLSKACFSQ